MVSKMNVFGNWKENRTRKAQLEDIKEVETPAEVTDVNVEPVEAPVSTPVENDMVTETEPVAEEEMEIEIKITNKTDLDLAKQVISDALKDADIDFELEGEEEEETEEGTEEDQESEEAEGESEEVPAEEEKDEMIEANESKDEDVDDDVDTTKKFAKKKANKEELKKRAGCTDYKKTVARKTLAEKASNLKINAKYLMEDTAIEIMNVNLAQDMVEYFDAKQNKKISGSLKEVEEKINKTNNERLAKFKAQANNNGFKL